MTKIKAYYLILFVLFIAPVCFSETTGKVDLLIVSSDGQIHKRSLAKNITSLQLSDGEAQKYRISSIQNLNDFPNLESIGLNFVSEITDYSFLKKAYGLKNLYLVGATVSSLKFLEDMPSLVKIALVITIPESSLNNFTNEEVNFEKLTELKSVIFQSNGKVFFPPFINVQNKPCLCLRNNFISEIPQKSIKNLSQYSWIDFLYNPLTPVDLQSYGIKTRFHESDNVPTEILDLFEY